MEDQTPEVVLSPQKPKYNLVLWIVVGFATLATGVGIGLAIGKYFQSASSTTSASTIIPSPNPFPTEIPVKESDPTANWKTYTNNSLNYSIEIPIDWDVNDSRFPDKGYVVIKPNNIEDFLLIISSQKNKVKSLSEWISLNGEPRQNQHKITLNDHEAILTTDTIVYQGDTLPTTTNHYYLINNNDGHSIHEVTSNEKYYPILNQILSTFKFIE